MVSSSLSSEISHSCVGRRVSLPGAFAKSGLALCPSLGLAPDSAANSRLRRSLGSRARSRRGKRAALLKPGPAPSRSRLSSCLSSCLGSRPLDWRAESGPAELAFFRAAPPPEAGLEDGREAEAAADTGAADTGATVTWARRKQQGRARRARRQGAGMSCSLDLRSFTQAKLLTTKSLPPTVTVLWRSFPPLTWEGVPNPGASAGAGVGSTAAEASGGGRGGASCGASGKA